MAKSLHIDLEDIRRLGALQCTEKEAASFFGISKKRFLKIIEDMPEVREEWERGQDSGKISLRRKQFRLAGISSAMAIHLGKNLLNQKDVIHNEVTGKNGGPIESLDLTKLDQNERDKLRSLINRSSKSETNS